MQSTRKTACILHGGTMKRLGILLIAIGLAWGFFAVNMPTTAETDGQLIKSSEYSYRIPKALAWLPTGLARNIGLIGHMDQRRKNMMISAVLAASGIILFGFGAVVASRKHINETTESHAEAEGLIEKDQKKCPSCAEFIELESLKCKHCGQIFDSSEIKRQGENKKLIIEKTIIGDKSLADKSTFKKIYSIGSKIFMIGCIIYFGIVFIVPILFPEDLPLKFPRIRDEQYNKILEEQMKEDKERQKHIEILYLNGRPSSVKCPIHTKTLLPDKVTISYGLTKDLFAPIPDPKKKNFPYSNQYVLGGCEISDTSPTFMYVLYCPSCRKVENNLMKKKI